MAAVVSANETCQLIIQSNILQALGKERWKQLVQHIEERWECSSTTQKDVGGTLTRNILSGSLIRDSLPTSHSIISIGACSAFRVEDREPESRAAITGKVE